MKLYHLNIKTISENRLKLWFEQMSDDRKENVRNIKVTEKQKSKIIADALCRKAISEFCGISDKKIVFQYNAYGKPYIENNNVYFNVSHSGDYVICAVSDKEIGVDIEKIRNINPRTANRFATDKEKEYISSNKNGFFEIWTLKEAYFKCIGTGLNSEVKNISFEISDGTVICSKCGFTFKLIDIDESYICSVCEKATQN